MSRRAKAVHAIATLAAVLLLGSACSCTHPGDRSAGSSAKSSHAASFTYLGPVRAAAAYFDGGLRVEPPDDAVARMTPEAAFAALCSASASPCPASPTPTMTLAKVSYLRSGRAVNGNLVVAPQKLAYLVTWRDQACAPAGPLPVKPVPESTRWVTTVVADATTGQPATMFEASGNSPAVRPR